MLRLKENQCCGKCKYKRYDAKGDMDACTNGHSDYYTDPVDDDFEGCEFYEEYSGCKYEGEQICNYQVNGEPVEIFMCNRLIELVSRTLCDICPRKEEIKVGQSE